MLRAHSSGVDGELSVWPRHRQFERSWYGQRFLPTLEPLTRLDVEGVLVTHGEPVLLDGGRALWRPAWHRRRGGGRRCTDRGLRGSRGPRTRQRGRLAGRLGLETCDTAREVVAETVDSVAAFPGEDETAKPDGAPSVTELLVRLGRDVSALVFCEAELVASRNLPEVRRAARDMAGALLVALAFLSAFVLGNVVALQALSTVMSAWLAALVLCAVWLVLGAVLLLALMVRASHVTGWRWWRVFSAGPEEGQKDLEQARAEAEQAVRDTLARLAPAIMIEIASASVGVAGDMAGDVVDVGQDLLETSDEMVEAIADDLPGGSVVSQMWDVALMPGRFGVKVATTVLRRGESSD